MFSARTGRHGPLIVAVALLTGAAVAGPFDVLIDPNQSVLTFVLCVAGKCDDDWSPVTGTVRIALDCVDLPTQIWLYDLDLYLQRNLHFYISWGIFGYLNATANNVSIHYAYEGTVLGPEAVTTGAYTFPEVWTTKQGTLNYTAVGVPCAALQGAGHPCTGTRNLADDPPSSDEWSGTVSSSNRVVTLVTNVDDTQPLDPNNPSLGTWRVYGTVRGSAHVPRPPGDVDGDGDLDFLDFIYFAGCMGGPGITTPAPGCTAYRFGGSDVDYDGDADLADFAQLQHLMST